MARYLAYTSPARGHLYPIVASLLELRQRGHDVHVRTLAADIPALRAVGLQAEAIDPAIEEVTLDTWRATTPEEGLAQALRTFARRGALEVPDLRRAIAEVDPDGLLIDITTAGAAAVAEASAIPWARSIPLFQHSSFPGTDPDQVTMAPFGLAPAGVEVLDELRRQQGLPPLAGAVDLWRAPIVLYYTALPFEPGLVMPPSFRLVGPGLWEPPAEAPVWFEALKEPVVLVSVSSEFQNDDALVEATFAALGSDDLRVVVTTAAHLPDRFQPPANARLDRFLSHGPLLRRAACVVCHGGMGITQKALAAGVPLCIVPFGRDQFDVAERVVQVGAGTRVLPWELDAASLGTAVRQAMAMGSGAKRIAAGFARAGGASASADALESLLNFDARRERDEG